MNFQYYTTVKLQYICITDIDECDSDPCEHGNCKDGINSYTCECEDGYTGDNCTIGMCILLLLSKLCGVKSIHNADETAFSHPTVSL